MYRKSLEDSPFVIVYAARIGKMSSQLLQTDSSNSERDEVHLPTIWCKRIFASIRQISAKFSKRFFFGTAIFWKQFVRFPSSTTQIKRNCDAMQMLYGEYLIIFARVLSSAISQNRQVGYSSFNTQVKIKICLNANGRLWNYEKFLG